MDFLLCLRNTYCVNNGVCVIVAISAMNMRHERARGIGHRRAIAITMRSRSDIRETSSLESDLIAAVEMKPRDSPLTIPPLIGLINRPSERGARQLSRGRT